MLPFNIELNPTELCNLKCNFCPRSQDYPNSNLHMTPDTIDRILDHVKELIEFKNKNNISDRIRFSYTGRGEPVLQKNFRECIGKVIEFRDKHSTDVIIVLNTNGYKFDKHIDVFQKIDDVYFNVYYNYSYKEYLEFSRQYKSFDNIHVKRRKEGEESEKVNYNARSGAILNDLTMVVARENNYGFCNKPFMNLFIDWNGDYILCCNDWVIMEPLDNVHNSSILDFYYNNKKLELYKRMLIQEKRVMAPCSTCNHFSRITKEQLLKI